MADNAITGGVTPYLTVRGAKKAVDFYTRAFGAHEVTRQAAEDGERLIHCHLKINGGDVLMSDDFPEFRGESGTEVLGDGPRGVTMHLQVDDADRWWKRAIDAGATVKMELADQFWGDRYGQVRDTVRAQLVDRRNEERDVGAAVGRSAVGQSRRPS